MYGFVFLHLLDYCEQIALLHERYDISIRNSLNYLFIKIFLSFFHDGSMLNGGARWWLKKFLSLQFIHGIAFFFAVLPLVVFFIK